MNSVLRSTRARRLEESRMRTRGGTYFVLRRLATTDETRLRVLIVAGEIKTDEWNATYFFARASMECARATVLTSWLLGDVKGTNFARVPSQHVHSPRRYSCFWNWRTRARSCLARTLNNSKMSFCCCLFISFSLKILIEVYKYFTWIIINFFFVRKMMLLNIMYKIYIHGRLFCC